MFLKRKPAILTLVFSIFAVFTLSLVACSSGTAQMPELYRSTHFQYVPDTGFVQDADSAVSHAKAEGAEEDAPKDYALASDKLKEAEALFRFDNRSESLRLAQQSEVDAQVAAAEAVNARLDRKIQAMRAKNDQLQKQVDQNR